MIFARIGEIVGIVHPRSTGEVQPQGMYEVESRDNQITLLRCLDTGRARRFSSLTGVERDGISVSFDTAKVVHLADYAPALQSALVSPWPAIQQRAQEEIPVVRDLLATQ
jgi:hypothetical protein